MIKYLSKALQFFGLLCTIYLSFYFVSYFFIPSSYEKAMEEFGTEERQKAMRELFDVLKEKGLENPELTDLNPTWLAFPVVKRVSVASLPSTFKGHGQFWNMRNTGSSPEWGDVLAYFNDDGEIIGVEFYLSRYGGFISDSPSVSPSSYNSLYRVEGNLLGSSDYFISLIIK